LKIKLKMYQRIEEFVYLLMSAGSASGVWAAVPVGGAPQISRAASGDEVATERAAAMAKTMDVKEGILGS
jgi:hypothetical protein